MAEIQAFRGLRYDLGHVGSLSDVVAPPYDVIDPQLQDQLYKRHPANVIRLILNRQEPGDDEACNRYSRAAAFLKNWRAEGVLRQEADPAIYVYHQVFAFGGQEYTRRGFMARIRLQPFGEGDIYPHEETHAAAKADRLRLLTACQASLSQIFGLYPDPQNQAQEVLEQAILGQTPIQAEDHLGVVHRLWPVADVKLLSDVAGAMSNKPIFIADGHHRYETACVYRDQLAAKTPLDPSHPANFTLMMCVSMNDPGMIVLPTHRLFRGLPPLTSGQLREKLGEAFECQHMGQGLERAPDGWRAVQASQRQGVLGFYCPKDDSWLTASITERGRTMMDQAAADRSPAWRELGVGVLHRLVIGSLLDSPELPEPLYVHRVEELIAAFRQSDEFRLASLVMPATLDHIRAVSQQNERMPAKSTYFYPKLLSGLVINPFV